MWFWFNNDDFLWQIIYKFHRFNTKFFVKKFLYRIYNIVKKSKNPENSKNIKTGSRTGNFCNENDQKNYKLANHVAWKTIIFSRISKLKIRFLSPWPYNVSRINHSIINIDLTFCSVRNKIAFRITQTAVTILGVDCRFQKLRRLWVINHDSESMSQNPWLGWVPRNFKIFIFEPKLSVLKETHKNDN